MKRNRTVDEYFENLEAWKSDLEILREILRDTELVETVKWGAPVYTFDGKHIVGLGGFKSYFGLWFFQGALLKDEKGKLINAQEGKTKAMRQWRFESADAIDENLVKAYVEEAIENAKSGKEIKPERDKPLTIPAHLSKAFEDDPDVEKAFGNFTLSKQREFTEYIDSAKREDTKKKRIEKIVPMILQNVGLNDKYR